MSQAPALRGAAFALGSSDRCPHPRPRPGTVKDRALGSRSGSMRGPRHPHAAWTR
jgi:hypothetical protein